MTFSKTRRWTAGCILAVAASAAVAATVNQPSASGETARTVARTVVLGAAQTPIKHIIFIQKENRSFDEYFGALSKSNPGINGATSAKKHNGTTVKLPQTPDPLPN